MVCNMLLKQALEIDGLQHVAEVSFGDRWFAACCTEGSFRDRWFAACCTEGSFGDRWFAACC